jgi:hypothetical protein
MRHALALSTIIFALGCKPKTEAGPSSTDKCEAEFSLEFTSADGESSTSELSFCGGIDIDAGFEWTDDAHLRYIGVAMQSKSGGNCYIAVVIDPYCGEDMEERRPYIVSGPAGWGAKTTLVLDDCPDLPEGAAATWNLDEGELAIAVGFKHPGDTPGAATRIAPVGTLDGSGELDGMTVNITGDFKIDRKTTAGEVEESVCD